MKIYTKTGDEGETSLVGGRRISKSALRLECSGTVDELNSSLGVALADIQSQARLKSELDSALTLIQNELFQLGSILACDDPGMAAKLSPVSPDQIQRLEKQIDQWTAQLPALKNFILPGGSRASATLHWARTVCRRAERLCVRLHEQVTVDPLVVQYLNRLSDHLFVAARYANHLEGVTETIWKAKG